MYQTVPFWLGVPNDARVRNEINDSAGSLDANFGGAEVLENLSAIPGIPYPIFHLVYYPIAYQAGAHNFGEIDLGFMAGNDMYSAMFYDPRNGAAFADSLQRIGVNDLVSGYYTPVSSNSLNSAFTAPPVLRDVVLVCIKTN